MSYTNVKEQKQLILFEENKKHISFSEFSLYKECPHKHLIFKYLQLDVQPPSIHLYFGNAIHEAIEVGVKEKLSFVNRANYFANKFKKDMMDNMLNDESFKDVGDFIEQGNRILLTLDIEVLLKGYEIISVEEHLYEQIYRNFSFKGFIDLVAYNPKTKKYLIIDWKTSGEKWDVARKKRDKTFLCQMRFYKYFWAVKNNIPLENIECKYVVLNRLKNKKDPRGGFGEIQIVDVNSTNEEVLNSLKELASVVRKIHIEKIFPKVKITGNERYSCMFCKHKGGTSPLCNSKYNQYVELINEQKNK